MRTDFSTSLMEERARRPIKAAGVNPPKIISRRKTLSSLILLAAAGVAIVATPSIVRYTSSGLREEEVDAFKTQENVYVNKSTGLRIEIVPITYLRFRGSTFAAYPVTADVKDKGPLSLINRANKVYSPNPNITENMDSRTIVELFSILHYNRDRLAGLNLNKIVALRLKTDVATPSIQSGTLYQVPIPVGYSSLEDAIASVAYNRHRQQ